MKNTDINIRDPFVLYEDGKYYMYGSRGSETWGLCTGLDVYVSDDLETFSDPIEVFTPPADFWSDRNFWAPEVHKYEGAYYMLATFYAKDKMRGTQILKAESPLGPFKLHSEGPVTPADWMCLDGTLHIENGTPYMVFCHEWVQVHDGEMCVIELSKDLTKAVGEPKVLFTASSLPGVCEVGYAPGQNCDSKGNFVTDGPFMYRTKSGRLLMIWSSFTKEGYCEAISYSDNGSVLGNWAHEEKLLFSKDGGHGMLFYDKAGDMKFAYHQPNNPKGAERPHFADVEEKNDTLIAK
ncbi:MAG: family 43 glycosylhydrolase [Clostridia bacterium]|nr:family 43 glycosylhydrolase [Clostridia bacterium]